MRVVAERKLQIRTLFTRFDRNNDNMLTRKEFMEGIKSLDVCRVDEMKLFFLLFKVDKD